MGKSQPVFAFLPKYAGEAAGGRFFVRKYIFYGNEKVIQDEKMVKEDKKEGKKKNIILWERAVLFGALIVVGIWKREKVKEIWKNLS